MTTFEIKDLLVGFVKEKGIVNKIDEYLGDYIERKELCDFMNFYFTNDRVWYFDFKEYKELGNKLLIKQYGEERFINFIKSINNGKYNDQLKKSLFNEYCFSIKYGYLSLSKRKKYWNGNYKPYRSKKMCFTNKYFNLNKCALISAICPLFCCCHYYCLVPVKYNYDNMIFNSKSKKEDYLKYLYEKYFF